MTKKKAKAEKAEKAHTEKAAKRNPTERTTRSKKQADPAEVREELAGMVKSGARGIAKAVISHAMQGELAPAKYLLEMAGVFPATHDGEQATEEEDCLAKTLLDCLHIPPKTAEDEGDKEAKEQKEEKNEIEPAPGAKEEDATTTQDSAGMQNRLQNEDQADGLSE